MSARTIGSSHEHNSPGQAGGITRRSFVAAGCAGAFSLFMPHLASFGNAVAYAVETGGVTASGQPEFDIYVITREEIGISVVDVTGNAKTPVAGASITLTSSSTNATATATADENGLAVFNLKAANLGVPITLEGVGASYRFEGSIKTVVPGGGTTWMDFETGRLRADGGSAVQTPLRKKASVSDPYFVMLSFDGWDILYTDNDTVSTPANADDHTFAGKLYVPAGTTAKFELIARASGAEDIVVFTKNAEVKDGFAEFSQTARYLLNHQDNKALLPDDRTYLYRVTVNGTAYTVTTKFTVREAPVAEPVYLTSSWTPDEQAPGSFSLPTDIPAPLGGTNLNIWCPTLRVMGWISPQGYAVLAGTLSTEFRNTASFTDTAKWKDETCRSAKDQFEWITDVWAKSLEKLATTSNLLDPKASVKDKFAMSHAFSIDTMAQVYLLGEWDRAAKLWRATLNGLISATLGFTFTVRVTVGPVPLFLTFALSLGGKVSLSIGVETIDFKTANIPRTSGFGYTTTISVALTLGAGVPAVASVGLRGSGYLVFYVGFDASGAVPHMVAGFGLAADVVVQMLLFTWTGKLWSYKKDPFFDNAKANLLQDARPDLTLNPTEFALGTDAAGNPLYSHTTPFDPTKGLDLDEFIRQSSIVTEQTLGKTVEVKGTRTANASLLAQDAPPVTVLDNGIALVDLSGMAASAAELLADNADAPSAFAYEYVGDYLDETCESFGGVAGVAETGGVEPTVDKKIATRIFGSPSCKMVVFLDTPYLFRLISVDYDDGGVKKTRTRLAVQKMNANGKWTTPQVLEFRNFDQKDAPRIDTFDYDFDVYANESATTGYVDSGLCVVLLSGTRPQGDSTDFFSASNSTLMSVGIFDSGLRCTMSYTWKDVPGSAAAPYQALLLPRITPVSTGGDDADTMGIALLYMRRTANSADQVLGNNARVTAEYGYLVAAQLYLGGREQIEPSTYDLKVFDNSTRGAKEASFSFAAHSDKGMSINTVFPWRGGKALTAETAHLLQDAATASQTGFTLKHNIVNAAGLANSQPWPRRSAVLAPEDGVLTALFFDPTVEGGSFEKLAIGPTDEKISTFAVSPTGETIFYLVNQEGDMPKVDGQGSGDGTPAPTEKIKRHTIYACALVDDLFSKPFPLANTSHAIDALENAYAGSTYSFVATCITDMKDNRADIYYINVPAVTTATPLGFVAENAFVCAGASDEPFLMELRNDGNVILTGCTVELRDADLPEPNNVVDTVEAFRFDKTNLTGSVWNPELLEPAPGEEGTLQATGNEPTYAPETLEALGIGENHVLVSPSSAGSLLPGFSGQYRISFDIPASWKSGHKNVYITCKDFMYDTLKLAEGVGDVLEHPSSLAPDDAHQVTISTAQPSDDDALGDALLVREGSTPGDSDGDQTGDGTGGETDGGADGAGDSGENAGGGAGSQTAPTGDRTPFTLAGLAVAAAAAGITAYSVRRRMVEREQDETSDSGIDS